MDWRRALEADGLTLQASAPNTSALKTIALSGSRSFGYHNGACPSRVARKSTHNMAAMARASSINPSCAPASKAIQATKEGSTLNTSRA